MSTSCHPSGGSSPKHMAKQSSSISGPLLSGPIQRRSLSVNASTGVFTDPRIGSASESHSHAAEERVGVILLNLGGPDTLNDVQPFLYNLFADPVCKKGLPYAFFDNIWLYKYQIFSLHTEDGCYLKQDIIRLPRPFRFLQRPLAQLISVLRAPKSKEGYVAIGGGSPLRKITDVQATAIKKALEEKEVHANAYVAMRYWHPYTEEAVQQVKRDWITKLVVLPLCPQFSISTTGRTHICQECPYQSYSPGINEKVMSSLWLT